MQTLIDVTKIPKHTKIEVIFGKAVDLKRGRINSFTISADLRQLKPFGYMVALPPELDATELSGDALREQIELLWEQAKDKPDLFIGGYKYSDGKTVVELSEWIIHKETAIHAAKLREQYSIWDLEAKEEIIILK